MTYIKRQTKCDVSYVRSHHLRMPLHLLLPGLAVKGWQRWQEKTA